MVEAPIEFTGIDTSGTVAVTVCGRAGARRVEIDPHWPHILGPSALGGAIMSAYHDAIHRAAEQYTPPEAGPPYEPPRLDLFTQRFDDPIAPARAELDRLMRRMSVIARRTEVRGPAGLLTLRLDHGIATGVDVTDARRAVRARPESIAAEALALLRSVEVDTEGRAPHGATRR